MVVAHGPYASCPMLDSPRTRPPVHPGRRDDDVRMHASPIQAVSASRSTSTRVVALPEVSMYVRTAVAGQSPLQPWKLADTDCCWPLGAGHYVVSWA